MYLASVVEYTSQENDDIEFLRLHSSPFDVIEVKWQSTSKIRLADLKTMNKLEDVTAKYPLMTNPSLNYLLVNINIDFNKII